MTMSLMTMAVGMAVAPGTASVGRWLAALIGTGLLVGSANTLNMYLERDTDGLMARTKNRPLPARRMAAFVALLFGCIQGVVAMMVLWGLVNATTAILGGIAIFSYVGVYTPLKRKTTLSTLVGALPGAIPPLMGWTAKTGVLHPAGIMIAMLLFLWQIPHFHAIAMYRNLDYQRAGLKTVPGVRSGEIVRALILPYLAAQVVVSIWLYPMGVAGIGYLAIAVLLGAGYLGYCIVGWYLHANNRWARNMFWLSIVYLPIVYLALVFNGSY